MMREQLVTWGADPEFFFERGGQIIGAERVIPEQGLDAIDQSGHYITKRAALIIDGVQAELNVNPYQRRTHLANELKTAFLSLRRHLAGMPEITTNFKPLIKVEAAELAALSEKARIFGCAPSKNIWNDNARVDVDAATYPYRAAGGHIHLGLHHPIHSYQQDNRSRLVPLLDIFVGNTCVLLDRDPTVVERRKHYGRAGEYRLPIYGLEYRTPGNFWLRSYPLMSFVFGMASLAVSVLYETLLGNNLEGELVGMVDIDNVIDAINLNDYDLAFANYETVKKFILCHGGIGKGLMPQNLAKFETFVASVREHGLEHWFPEDPVEHWCNLPRQDFDAGWEDFLQKIDTTPLPNEEGGV